MSISQNSNLNKSKLEKKRGKNTNLEILYIIIILLTKKLINIPVEINFVKKFLILVVQILIVQLEEFFIEKMIILSLICINHISFDDHSYIISKEFMEKYQNNKIDEKDFNNDKKNIY